MIDKNGKKKGSFRWSVVESNNDSVVIARTMDFAAQFPDKAGNWFLNCKDNGDCWSGSSPSEAESWKEVSLILPRCLENSEE